MLLGLSCWINMPGLAYSCSWGKQIRKQIDWGSTKGAEDKMCHSPRSRKPQDHSPSDATFNGVVVNEAWKLRYFSLPNQHWVKKKCQLYIWKGSEFFFKALIFPSCHSVLGKIVEMTKNLGRGFWDPWVESGLQGPGVQWFHDRDRAGSFRWLIRNWN